MEFGIVATRTTIVLPDCIDGMPRGHRLIEATACKPRLDIRFRQRFFDQDTAESLIKAIIDVLNIAPVGAEAGMRSILFAAERA